MRSVIRFNACIALIAAGLAALTLCAVFVPALLAAGRANEEKRAARYDPAADGPVLRLHIVANSDSQEDQRIKLAVRDALTAFERDETEILTSADAKAAEALINLCLNGAGNLRSTDQIKAKVDALRANLAEIRATANGNAAAEKAGVRFLHCLCGKSVQPGFIGKFMKATLTRSEEHTSELQSR